MGEPLRILAVCIHHLRDSLDRSFYGTIVYVWPHDCLKFRLSCLSKQLGYVFDRTGLTFLVILDSPTDAAMTEQAEPIVS
jgi:anti-anti-sigma regulatory factor